MHVLTKIFVVLVSLLAVLLVPLVVVYAYNEDSYKQKWEDTQAVASVLRAESASEQARSIAETTRLTTQIDELARENAGLEQELVDARAQVRRVESELAAEAALKGEIKADIARLSTTMSSSQSLAGSLLQEVRTLRGQTLTLERQKVDLDEALRDVSGQLEVAVQARRALQEELQQLKEELAQARSKLGEAVAQGFDPQRDVAIGAQDGVPPDRNLTATVINVRRSADQVLAEIDAGQRDGVQVGWVMSLGRGSMFTGKLRIISTDINRATGVVTLEDPMSGRTVQIGDEAVARAGER